MSDSAIMYSPSSVFSSEDEWTPTRCLLPMCGEIHISTLLPDGEPVQCLYRQTFSRQQRKRPHSMTAPALKAAEIERDVKRQRVIAQYRATHRRAGAPSRLQKHARPVRPAKSPARTRRRGCRTRGRRTVAATACCPFTQQAIRERTVSSPQASNRAAAPPSDSASWPAPPAATPQPFQSATTPSQHLSPPPDQQTT
jgi:hypothetical protein